MSTPSITIDDVRRLIDAAGERTPGALRDRALIALLYWGPLRVSEALALHPPDLDRASGTLRVVSRRAVRSRRIVVDPEGLAPVDAWLAARRRLGLGDDQPLICTLRGGPVDPSYVRALLPRIASAAGLARSVNALALRRARVAALVAGGLTTALLQERLGHASRTTTAHLLRRVAEELGDAGARSGVDERLRAAARAVRRAAGGEGAPWLTFSLIAREAASLVRAEHALVMRFDPDAGLARTVGSWTADTADGAGGGGPGAAGLDGDCLAAQVFRTGGPVRVEDLGVLSDPVPCQLAAIGYRCGLSAPVVAGTRVWGAVALASRRAGAFARGAEFIVSRFLAGISDVVAYVEERIGWSPVRA